MDKWSSCDEREAHSKANQICISKRESHILVSRTREEIARLIGTAAMSSLFVRNLFLSFHSTTKGTYCYPTISKDPNEIFPFYNISCIINKDIKISWYTRIMPQNVHRSFVTLPHCIHAGSKTATSEPDTAHHNSSREIPMETHGASKAVSSPPSQAQETQTSTSVAAPLEQHSPSTGRPLHSDSAKSSTGVAAPLEQHSPSTARPLHSDSAGSYHSDGPLLSSRNPSYCNGSPQNTTHPAADSTPPQRTRTVHQVFQTTVANNPV